MKIDFLKTLILNEEIKCLSEENNIIDTLIEYSKSDNGIIGEFLKNMSESIFSTIGELMKNGILILCSYAGGICLIVGSLGILGMMADPEGKLNCKKYVIGSLLVYIGIKCLILIIE